MDLTTFDEIRAKLNLASVARPAILGLVALLVMVAVFAGRTMIDAATATPLAIGSDDATVQASSGGSEAAVPQSGTSAASEPATIFVHVSGAVQNPGLVELPAGSRLASALDGAGGAAPDADLDSVNLARVLADGEQVRVAAIGEERPAPAQGVAASTAQAPSGLVNVNTADAAALEALPGIGPATALKIVQDREANGPFASCDDLKRVAGIGDKKYEAIRDLICV